MARTSLQWFAGTMFNLRSGGVMRVLLVLVMMTACSMSSRAGGAAKPKESKPAWMAEVLRQQHRVAERARWAQQVDPDKAYDVLLGASTFRHQYDRFEAELQGKEVAWVLARKDVVKDLSTNRFFVEHSGGKHAHAVNVETHLRCYVDDETAARVQAAAPEALILCIGKIVEFDFFQNFLAIGVVARNVTIGGDAIETWLEHQPKQKAAQHQAKH